jgi:hypothetical protein
MLARTHTDAAPRWVVQAADKKRARLNCIDHLLKQIPYEDVPKPDVRLPTASAMKATAAHRCRRKCMCLKYSERR